MLLKSVEKQLREQVIKAGYEPYQCPLCLLYRLVASYKVVVCENCRWRHDDYWSIIEGGVVDKTREATANDRQEGGDHYRKHGAGGKELIRCWAFVEDLCMKGVEEGVM